MCIKELWKIVYRVGSAGCVVHVGVHGECMGDCNVIAAEHGKYCLSCMQKPWSYCKNRLVVLITEHLPYSCGQTGETVVTVMRG